MVKKDASFVVQGTVKFKLERVDETVLEFTVHNLVVNYGLVGLATVIAGGSAFSAMTHLALGSLNTTPTLGDTALASESRRDPAVVTQLPNPEDNKVQFQVEHTLGSVVGTFSEAGLFDQATLGGNMLNRVVFNPLDVIVSDKLTVTWLFEIRNT